MPATTFTATITGLSHDGRGITEYQGRTTFISNALPQEIVQAEIVRKHSRFYEAHAIEILQASPERVTPPCEYFTRCGGCSLQHLSAASQLQFKQKTVLEQLQHFGKVTPEKILQPLSYNSLGYRRKARLGVRYVEKKSRVLVGFREKNSNFLADIQSCLVLHPHVGMKLAALSELIARLKQFRHIAQIEVAIGDDTTALVFRHLQPLPEEDQQKLKDFAQENNFTIFAQPNPPEPIYKIWPQDTHNTLHYSLPDYDLTIEFHPLDFTQINAEVNQGMLKQALQLLNPQKTDHVLDLFCGLGNFTLPLARFAKQVTGVEGNGLMIDHAQKNALKNNLVTIDFHVGNLMEPNAAAPWLQQTYDKILLDPPRSGAKEILPYFKSLAARDIVYVSCNPATLARDAGVLVHELGYTLKTVGIMDMFPHTNHIETIAFFAKI